MKYVIATAVVLAVLILTNQWFNSAGIASIFRCTSNHDDFSGSLLPLKAESSSDPPAIETVQRTATEAIIPDSSTGKVFSGEKIRDFSLPRAKLGKTRHSTELPFENDFKNKCTKWGVVTTIFDPTEAISRVSNLAGWCLVVVADTKTPTDYMEKFKAIGGSVDSTFFFSVEHQKRWEQLDGPIGAFVRAMPWRHFGRKNLGYLFAILHEAEFFFDFDDDNYIKLDETTGKPVEILPSITILENVTIAVVGPTAFNHHPMMTPSIPAPSWARGFPLEYIKDKATEGQAIFQESIPFVSESLKIGVIQFLADGNPDVDANHRLMRPLPVTFDSRVSVLVPKHAYSPYNAQASIHSQPSFWATLLPTTVPGRVSDIWRSYFAQCIFADANLRLIFSPPKIEQIRNDHNILGDLSAEHDLYTKSGKLIDFLSTWDSNYLTVPERVEQLWIDLYERSYIELDDVLALQKWLEALITMDYKFPGLKPRFRSVALIGQFHNADFPSGMTKVMFWSQTMRERFHTTIVAAPFNRTQLGFLKAHRIDVLGGRVEEEDTNIRTASLNNMMKTFSRFANSSHIEAVIYADALLNATELSDGTYPIVTDKIVVHRKGEDSGSAEYADLRTISDRGAANRLSYRVFPNGTMSNADKTIFGDTPKDLQSTIPNLDETCPIGQQQMTMDPEFAKYLDSDGSAWFPYHHIQSDFLLMPTKYAYDFADAANIHLKHRIRAECALGKIVDILQQQAGASIRLVKKLR